MMERIRPSRKRIMRSFRIDELSAVDSPSQRHAVAVLMKSAGDEPKREPAKLKNIEIDELSLVDKGANPGARVCLFKRDDEEEPNMEFAKITERPRSFDSFESACAYLQQHGATRLQALAQAAHEQPDLLQKFNAEGIAIAKAAQDVAAPRPIAKAIADFNKRVTEVMARDKISKLEALGRAAREFPDTFRAFQEV
jgi:hypothetical protein